MCNGFYNLSRLKMASDYCNERLIGSKKLADANETVLPETARKEVRFV
jgi:hypothetical protein